MDKLALVAYLSLFGADAASTHAALAQGPQAGHEVMLTQSGPINDVIIMGEAAAFYWVTHRIERPWLRWTVSLSIASLHGLGAAHNIREMRK